MKVVKDRRRCQMMQRKRMIVKEQKEKLHESVSEAQAGRNREKRINCCQINVTR